MNNPPQHQFTVFSIVNDDGSIDEKYVQCNNCDLVHKVTEISRSEIVPGRETMKSAITITDVKSSLSENLAGALSAHDVDLATWQAVQFIVENKRWGDQVVLTTDNVDGVVQGKYVRILGESLFKIESFIREEYVGNP